MIPSNSTDHGLTHIPRADKNIYSAETFIGNWYEETMQNTMKVKEFINKRECEELSIQKSQIMADILLKPVRFKERRDGLLYFEDSVQLISPGPDCATAKSAFPFKRYTDISHLALSASVPPTVIDHHPYLNTDSIISASPYLFPCVRNSFVIEKVDTDCICPESDNSVVHYGDVFRIRAMPTQHWPLYLHSSPGISLHTASAHSANPLVRFSDTQNPNTLWRLMPLDCMEALKIELGIPVPLKTRLLLQHALSGQNLSIEPDFPPLITYFGCEHEVTVHTKRDRIRHVTWVNHWIVDTQRGWGKPDKSIDAQAKLSASINADDSSKNAPTAKLEQEDEEVDAELAVESDVVSIGAVKRFQDEERAKEAHERRMITELPGYMQPYDVQTSPQPHAHDYRLSDTQEFYPNRKWDCGNTQCCFPPSPPQNEIQQFPPHEQSYDVLKHHQEKRK